MECVIDYRTVTPLPDGIDGIIRAAAAETLNLAGGPGNCTVSVSIVDNPEIREINRHYRNIDAETDVLSFPLVDFSGEDTDLASLGIEPVELEIGDIIISAPKALAQAELYGHTPEREIGFLTAHGMLHLLGHDHDTEAGERVMIDIQDEVMGICGLG